MAGHKSPLHQTITHIICYAIFCYQIPGTKKKLKTWFLKSTHQEAWHESSQLPCSGPCTTCPVAPRGTACQMTCAILIIRCAMHHRIAMNCNIFAKMIKNMGLDDCPPALHDAVELLEVAIVERDGCLASHY